MKNKTVRLAIIIGLIVALLATTGMSIYNYLREPEEIAEIRSGE
jgi:hypothetical protein